MSKKINPNYKYIGFSIILVLTLILLLQTPFITTINNLFLDPLESDVKARNEVVVVGIDDKSLNEIGAWPWDRSIFAKALDQLAIEEPTVLGFDILFLEKRAGDEAFIESINKFNSPIIFGSKLIANQNLESIYINEAQPNAISGFVNFEPDTDGKIRNSKIFSESLDSCYLSFAFNLSKEYFSLPNNKDYCNNQIILRNSTLNLDSTNSLRFSYTRESFSYISFSDLINGNYSKGLFKDKIILLGSTALDLRSELNDNFTDIYGRTIPGVLIHANIVNSFLETKFYTPISKIAELSIYLILSLILLTAFLKIRNSRIVAIIFTTAQAINFLATLVFIQFGILNLVINFAIFILALYIFALLYRYITQDKENQYIKSVFSRYLNPNLLNILLQNPDKLKLGGETREMSVMFSDIRGFTTISEGLTPQELVQMINDYLGYMSSIILKNNGTIDKYIGDAIMAFWNAPIDDLNYDTNAIKTALEMKQQLKEFGEIHPQYPTINIGIGINTGLMTVGNVGGKDRFDYTVLGDNVNLGSRLEGLTKKYGVVIIVAESTMKGNKDDSIIFRFLDEMKVKGKNDSVRIYEPMLKNEENLKTIEIYESGFALYQKALWSEAITILLKSPNDSASKLLIERIEGLKINSPENWNGIWKWDEK